MKHETLSRIIERELFLLFDTLFMLYFNREFKLSRVFLIICNYFVKFHKIAYKIGEIYRY